MLACFYKHGSDNVLRYPKFKQGISHDDTDILTFRVLIQEFFSIIY